MRGFMIIELQTLEIKSISGGMNFFSRICKVVNNVIGKPLESVGKSIKGALIDDGTDRRPPLRERDAERERQEWIKNQNNDQQKYRINPVYIV